MGRRAELLAKRIEEGAAGLAAVAAGLSDVGKQRVHNEDRFILLPEFSVYVVADGMGGHQSGEVASRMAASSIAAYFRNRPSWASRSSIWFGIPFRKLYSAE